MQSGSSGRCGGPGSASGWRPCGPPLLALTCYYYSFLLLTAPLTRARRTLEVPFLALAAGSQLVWSAFWWNDDRYAALSVLALGFCAAVLAAFTPGLRPGRR